MCNTGFSNTDVYDAYGFVNNVCLNQFCGLFGMGPGCAEVELDYCYKSLKVDGRLALSTDVFNNLVFDETCTICEPGTYRYKEFDLAKI
jgi:hypothetical protein